MNATDVTIVGGGPAGVATALHLVRAGHSVAVLERSEGVRDKVCGEGLMPYGVTELERLGILPAVVSAVGAMPFVGIGYHVKGVSAWGHFPAGRPGLGVRRSRLDGALVEAAAAEGIVVERGVSVGAIEIGERVTMQTNLGVRHSRMLVGADGMRSRVRRELGLERERRGRPRYGLRGHFRIAEGRTPLRHVEVFVVDGMELYLTPVGPRELNVAVLLEREGTRLLKGDLRGGFLQMVRRSAELAPWLEGAELCSAPALVGPLRNEATDVVANRSVLVGDAAGFLDGITGEGMSLTLLSARLAAATLTAALRTGRTDARSLGRYRIERERASRDLTWMTEIVLAGIRNRTVARRFVRGLARHPDVFDRVLAISAGTGTLMDVGLRGLVRVLA